MVLLSNISAAAKHWHSYAVLLLLLSWPVVLAFNQYFSGFVELISFSHRVFKRLVLKACKNKGLR